MGLAWQGWFSIAVALTALGLMFFERFPPARVLVGAAGALVLAGVLSPVEALVGFTNPGMLTVAVLFVMVAALKSTGAIRWVGLFVLGRSGGEFMARARLVSITSVLSAFINNTPIVAMLTPAVEGWCRRARVSPSRLLLPLSYATIVGGTCTLIGTSTNLIVSGMVKDHPALPTLNLFDPFWIGLPATLAGVAYMVVFGRWLLPDRASPMQQAADPREYALELLVEPGGPLVGKRIDQAGLRHLPGAFLVELDRDGEVQPAVAPETILIAGDRLVFVGVTEGMRELRQKPGLRLADDQVFRVGGDHRRHLVEVVLSRLSPVVGSTLRESEFRERYGAVAVALSRGGERVRAKLGEIELHAGDTLLLESRPSFMAEHGSSPDFLMVHLVDGDPPLDPRKAALSLGLLAAMVLANAVLGVDILVSAIAAAVLAIALGCVRLPELRRSLDLPLLISIACSFAVGAALEKTGVARVVALLLNHWTGADPMLSLVGVYLFTFLLTEFVTNNAAAIIMFPIGLATATQLGVSPMPFVMAVMIGASCAFLTPIGYQTNLMVYGPGGYRFGDYLRFGIPMAAIVSTTVLWAIPRAYPF